METMKKGNYPRRKKMKRRKSDIALLEMQLMLLIGLFSYVSITHRYGSTTVFTAFSIFIIPHFPCFSTFFSKKVGQPLHSKFPQSLDSTDFFIFVKIGSEVHRLFSRFFAVFGTFPCCFCSGSLDFTGLEVHRLFLQIF